MALKLGILLSSAIVCLIFILFVGCSATPKNIECPDCIQQECVFPARTPDNFAKLHCVPVEQVNKIINLTNELLIDYNKDLPENLQVNEVHYYDENVGVQ